jgi:TPP-dependent pyruvate/acetoin dehydrogenase alpha subunit
MKIRSEIDEAIKFAKESPFPSIEDAVSGVYS